MDTPYALSYVHEVYTRSIYSYALHEAAKKTLTAAAKRRQVSLLDLFDELTPSFELGPEGLVLDVGPYHYTVSVATDLSLRICNEQTAKTTKSLPKAKTNEDPAKRQAAESAFKFLRGNLKKVAKQQAKRLQEALICDRTWPVARWRTLFLEHPLLGILGQGFIWHHRNADHILGSFRISEDHSLIDAEDEEIKLADSDSVGLWHPIAATDEEIAAWREHFQDYEISSLLDQLGQSRLRPTEAEMQSEAITRFQGVKVEQFIVKRFMESWNYSIHDQDGSHIFGYDRRFPLLQLTVVLETEGMDAYSFQGATVTLGQFEFYRGHERLPLEQVPPTLLAAVLGQSEALRAKQVGGN